jgi:DNA-binding MarR family transcriptional regulator
MNVLVNVFGKIMLQQNQVRAILMSLRCSNHNKRLMLDTFITSRVRRKIVVVYAKYPDFKTHVRGLAKLIKEDAGNIQRELKKLEKAGFLISEKQGNTKVYYTNKHFLIFKELQSIVLKSQRAAQKRQQSSQ